LEAERLEHQQALDSIVKENDQEMERLTADIKCLKNELEKVKDKLQRGIEENEVLCAKLRDIKASPASTPSMHRRFSKRSLSRVDSLSDLASSTSLEDADQIATWDRDRYADH
jgi:regulator of replication initiation timing